MVNEWSLLQRSRAGGIGNNVLYLMTACIQASGVPVADSG